MKISQSVGGSSAKDPWECNGMPIPEVFPNRVSLLKTVALGIGITAVIFGLVSLLLIHS